MIVGRMVKYARTLLALLSILVVSSLVMGTGLRPASESGAPHTPAVEGDSTPSVTCTPFGLYGDITAKPLVGRLSDTSDNLTFVGTTNGLYVVAPGGQLHHFLYSPFGIKHIALINDVTGDGIREVVVALDDTQVPALRCYDGATWEEVWQFAPMTRIWDKLWVDRQLIINNLAVVDKDDSQSLLITSGRCVLSIDATDGTEQWRFLASATVWRMVTLADLNGDDADEAVVGADDGHLVWLNADTGKLRWQITVPEHKDVNRSKTWMPDETEHLVSDIMVVDEETGKVAVASGYGAVDMYDLREKRRIWDKVVFTNEDPNDPTTSSYVCMSLTPDMTGDGLGEILLSKILYSSQYNYRYSGMTNGEMALCDSAGNTVWHRGTGSSSALVWPGMAFETSVFDSKPVFIQRQDGIALVNLGDGQSVLHTIPLDAVNGAGVVVKQPGGDGYLSFSSYSDLAAISANGELLWYYPRIGDVKAVSGSFVGDDSEDVLLCAESGGQPYSPFSETAARLLHMMDGASGAKAWSYEVPYSELKRSGGLKGIQVTADMVGSDNLQDIIGYCEDKVFIFSGKDGTPARIPVGQPITSLDIIRNGASGIAFAVGIANGLNIFDSAMATPLWTTTTADWIGEESGRFMALDDINSDNVSDLAVISDSMIVVLKSAGDASDYELHQTIHPESGSSIRLPEMIADCDQDGIRELAFFQEGARESGEIRGSVLHNLLCVQSPEDGQCLFRAELQLTLAYDLACGDFNADGYPDSVLLLEWNETDANGRGAGNCWLRILSGKDGSVMWQRRHETGSYIFGGSSIMSNALPAINVGDVNGDGADDLACSVDLFDRRGFSGLCRQQSLQVIDVAQDTTIKEVAVTPGLYFGVFATAGQAMLKADSDADGHPMVTTTVLESSAASHDGDGSSSPSYMALVDVDSGRRLAGFTGFDAAAMSLFESHQPGVLGVAACGGLCYLHVDSDVQITSPEEGARTEPIVGIEWDGPSDGSFSQVFVDGVCNDVTNGCESEIFLARGNHTIVIKSIDEYGRIYYGPSDLSAPLNIKVAPSPWKPVWLVVSLFALLAIVFCMFYPRLQRTWRARMRAAK